MSRAEHILRLARKAFLQQYAWVAETLVCAVCGKRRRTYQPKSDDFGNDPRCYKCLKQRVAGAG